MEQVSVLLRAVERVIIMRCRKCGNEIRNVPEHLRDLADWICRDCTNAAPRRATIGPSGEIVREEAPVEHQSKKAA